MLLLLLVIVPQTVGSDEGLDGKQLYVYFGNGMFTKDETAARKNRIALERRFKRLYGDSELLNKIRFKTSYNYSENIGSQILEVVRQKNSAERTAFYRWVSGSPNTPKWLREFFEQAKRGASISEYIVDKDLKEHVSSYRENIENGDCILVVAHSQGNLYANFAYDRITAYSERMQVLSVGTPDHRVAGGGNYTTLDEDWIIDNGVGVVSPLGTMNSTTTNCKTTFCNEGDWSGHQFIASYLNGKNSDPRIKGSGPQIEGYIKEAVSNAQKVCEIKVGCTTVTNVTVSPTRVSSGQKQIVQWESTRNDRGWYFFYLWHPTEDRPIYTGNFLANDCAAGGSSGTDGCLGQQNPAPTIRSDSWAVPEQLPPGEYRIKVAVWCSASEPAVGAISAPFTVVTKEDSGEVPVKVNEAPSIPSIDVPPTAKVNKLFSVNITRGKDPDGDEVKVSCTAEGSNQASPFELDFKTGDTTETLGLSYSTSGSKEIKCFRGVARA